MKYKIGDKVVLRKDLSLDKMYGELALLKGVRDALLKEDYVEIISIVRNKYYGINIGYVVSEEMIEGLLKPKAIKYDLIITSTNKVIILDKENGRKSIATCHPDDEYSVTKGFEIAWNRLNEIGTVMNLDTINLSPMKSPENNSNYIVHKNGNPLNNEVNNLESIVLKKPLLTEEINKNKDVHINVPIKDLFNLTESERRILAKQLADEILKEIEAKIGKINK